MAKTKATAKKPAKVTAKKPAAKPAKAARKESHIQVRGMMKKIDPKVKLSDDAAELLEDYLVQLFSTIAEGATKIVQKAQSEKLSPADVKKAVRKVFSQNQK